MSIKFSVKTIFILTTIINCSLSFAHFDASDPFFCYKDEKIMYAEVAIKGQSLMKLIPKESFVNCPVGISPKDDELSNYIGSTITNNNPYFKHDIFDMPLSAQKAYSFASCQCASMLNEKIDPNSIRPLLEGPEELLSPDHDNNYELSQGIKFSCFVCKSKK